jgi:hypothetical protein
VRSAPPLLVIQHEVDDHLNELGGSLDDAGMAIERWFTYVSPGPLLEVSEYDAPPRSNTPHGRSTPGVRLTNRLKVIGQSADAQEATQVHDESEDLPNFDPGHRPPRRNRCDE